MYNFSQDIALKHNGNLVFGKDDVYQYLDKKPDLLKGLNMEHLYSNAFSYGFNVHGAFVKIGYFHNEINRVVIVEGELKRRLRIDLSYDGKGYNGFQIQKNQRTVQGVISDIVSKIIGKETLVQGASRTDALVHAYQQVIHFDTDLDIDDHKWKEIMNHQLPNDIYIHQVKTVHPLFHSRYDTVSKTYEYKLYTGEYNPFLADYAVHIEGLDLMKLKSQFKDLIGIHDFTSFAKKASDDNVREIYELDVKLDQEWIIIKIKGSGFLRYMVRLIVQYLLDYGMNKTNVPVTKVLASKIRDFTKEIAPASGLYLKSIEY